MHCYMRLRCCRWPYALYHEAEVMWTTWWSINCSRSAVDDLMHYYMMLRWCGRPDALLYTECLIFYYIWLRYSRWPHALYHETKHYYMRMRCCGGLDALLHEAEMMWKTRCTITYGWGVCVWGGGLMQYYMCWGDVDDLMQYYMRPKCCGGLDALLHVAGVLWTPQCAIAQGQYFLSWKSCHLLITSAAYIRICMPWNFHHGNEHCDSWSYGSSMMIAIYCIKVQK